jgi:hypothetical protein
LIMSRLQFLSLLREYAALSKARGVLYTDAVETVFRSFTDGRFVADLPPDEKAAEQVWAREVVARVYGAVDGAIIHRLL